MVHYKDSMQMLDQMGMGAVVLAADNSILDMNDCAKQLLGDMKPETGEKLPDALQPLCLDSELRIYVRVDFNRYLLSCRSPETEGMPDMCRLVVFRDATVDACHDMLKSTLNKMKEAVVLCDEDGRVYFINDSAVQLDSFVYHEVMGKTVAELYDMLDGKELSIPQVLASKRSKLNYRHYYKTRYGKEVTSISNTHPILQNGQMLGAVNILEDLSNIDSLTKQLVDLQEQLRQHGKKQNARSSSLRAKYTFRDIAHVSQNMDTVIARCKQTARSDSSVMIYGETGTGKELFAQSIHNASNRADGPFVALNCAAIPETLLESLLFGSEKGAFTGAEQRIGLFEQANHGTLLLDEINSMDINLQSKLLRVLQEGKLRHVGGMQEIDVDVRVLSNINIPPLQAVEEGKLRQDLYYRLGVVQIHIPSLRERAEDLELLTKAFILQCNKKMGRNVREADNATLDLFRRYEWPGNVRELQHAVEHAMNILPDAQDLITPEYLPEHIRSAVGYAAKKESELPIVQHPIRRESGLTNSRRKAQTISTERPIGKTMREMERETICQVLKENNGNISQSARVLQMSRQNLQYRIRRYGIDIEALLKTM